MTRLYVGDLVDKVTLDIAKPMLIRLGRDRVHRSDLSAMEEEVLQLLVLVPDATATSIAKKLNKTPQYIGRVFTTLIEKNLVSSQKEGRDRTYIPSIDAIIAYIPEAFHI
ncbi:MAG: hypothetical protein HKM04_06685 [Legionellales bacterium]|nr:hypothetical protein [Legionellales bacterium]